MVPFPDCFWTNLPYALGYWLLNSLYFPLNWLQKRQHIDRCLATKWDRKLPYIKQFFYIYALSLGLIVIGPLLFALLLPHPEYFRFVISLAIALGVNFIFWLLYPCKIERTDKETDPHQLWFVKAIKGYGHKYGDYNSFPSAHVTLVSLMFLWLVFTFPQLTVFWLSLIILNFLSVLLTHQHYLADALAGLGLAGVVFMVVTKGLV